MAIKNLIASLKKKRDDLSWQLDAGNSGSVANKVSNSTFIKGNVPSREQQLQRVTPQFQKSVQPIARQANIYKSAIGSGLNDIGSGIRNLPQTFSMLKNNPQQFSKGVDLAIDNSLSGRKAGRYALKGVEGFTEGMSLGTYDLPISASRNNYERSAYVGGNIAGMVNPFNPVSKLAPMFKPASRPLQQPLGHLAGRMIAQGGGKKLLGQGVANLAQGIPYTTAYAVAKTGLGGKYSGGDLATDTGTDLALGSIPMVGGLLIGAKGALKSNGKPIGTMAGDFASTVDKKLRRQISDSLSKVNDKEWTNIRDNLIKTKTGASFLGDLFKHDRLYKAYPEFRKLTVKLDPEYVASATYGSFNPNDYSIRVNPNLSNGQAKSTLLHEIEHAIQTVEDFAKGASYKPVSEGFVNHIQRQKQSLMAQMNSATDPMQRQQIQQSMNMLDRQLSGAQRRAGLKYSTEFGEFDARAVESRQNIPQRELTGTDPFIGQLRKEGLTPKDLKVNGVRGVNQSTDPLIAEARKYKSAEEFVNRYYDTVDENASSFRNTNINNIKQAGLDRVIDNNGNLTLYHGTSASSAKSIRNGGKLKGNTYFAADRETAMRFGRNAGGKTEVIEVKVDPADVMFDGNYFTSRKPNLILDRDNVFREKEIYSKATDIWNQANKGEMMSMGVDNGVVKPQWEITEEKILYPTKDANPYVGDLAGKPTGNMKYSVMSNGKLKGTIHYSKGMESYSKGAYTVRSDSILGTGKTKYFKTLDGAKKFIQNSRERFLPLNEVDLITGERKIDRTKLGNKYKTINQDGIKEVEGKPLNLVDGVETFIHQGDNPKRTIKGFVISEKSTGRYIASGETEREAVRNAKEAIESLGEEKFKQLIAQKQLSQPQIDRTRLTGMQLETPNAKLQSPEMVRVFGKQAGAKSQTKIPVKGQQGTKPRMSGGNTSRQPTRPQANASYDGIPNLSNYDQTFSKFIANREVGKTTATQTAGKYASIPRKIAKEVIDYMEGINKKATPEVQKWGKQMKAEYDRLHEVAKQSAVDAGLDVGYLENYVPHFWKESAEEVQQAFMSAKKNLPQSKERIFPTYEEGIKLGFTPKYEHPAQMMEAYVRNLEKFNASVDLMKTLKSNNIVVPASVGRTKGGYIPINAQGIGKNTTKFIDDAGESTTVIGDWYAPKDIAQQINRLFSPEPQTGVGKALGISANIAGKVQDLTLSGGIPATPINAFTIAQVQKELLSGHIKSPFSAMWNSLSSAKSVKFFDDNAEQIKKMQSQNVPFNSEYAVDNMIDEKVATKIFGHGVGNAWGKLVNEPTFKRFMPMLQVNLFNEIEKQALKAGRSADEATKVASKAVKNFYGLKGTDFTAKKSQLGKDVAGTFLFAPQYRESMINMWLNTVKAMKNPLALENRTNVSFAVGAVATYFAMNALNEKYSGHPIWENPEGKKDKLLIPLGDGYTIGVPFLSSIATMPRLAYSMAEKLTKGDITGTALEGRKAVSMALKPVIDVMANSDHFDRAIVEDADLPEEKLKKQAMFLFKSYMGHPYVKELIEAYTKPEKPLYQRLSNATELPLRFYQTKSVEEAPFWDRYSELKDLDEQYKLIEKTNPDKALELLNQNEDKINEFNLMKAYLDFQYQQIEGGEEPTGIKDYLNETEGEKARKYEQSEDAPKTTLGKAGLYAQSGLTNPVDTFNAVRTGQPIRKMRGDATIVEREIASTDKDKNTQKDHRIPLWAGGDNSDKNTYYISTEDHKRKTQYENGLRKKLESGEMKQAQVQDAIKKWHVDNSIKSLMPPIKDGKVKLKKKEVEDGYTYVDDKGTEKTIDLAFEPTKPELTGNKELDKKLMSKYTGEITKKKNDILALYEQGVLTAKEAEKELAKWETKSKKSGSKKGKKGTIKFTPPKYSNNAKASFTPIKIKSTSAPKLKVVQKQSKSVTKPDIAKLKAKLKIKV